MAQWQDDSSLEAHRLKTNELSNLYLWKTISCWLIFFIILWRSIVHPLSFIAHTYTHTHTPCHHFIISCGPSSGGLWVCVAKHSVILTVWPCSAAQRGEGGDESSLTHACSCVCGLKARSAPALLRSQLLIYPVLKLTPSSLGQSEIQTDSKIFCLSPSGY